uniref:NADH dehydrogenase subunit 4L n=1 Tax=Stygobromus allegheniensis TaxID=1677011 RepID=A0A6C0X575_9CRUS|nr:NADH dehydrogenase subunit 4L [Stygobromus allegheniensis]QIC54427.1 NADH dehydrogenase subunit 4L [Stygobromus allegheniensis]
MEVLLKVSSGFVLVVGLLKFVLNYTHLLVSLLSLEFIALGLFCGMSGVVMIYFLESFCLLYLIIMIVCEGVLGLALLVTSVNSHSMDYMNVFNFSMC